MVGESLPTDGRNVRLRRAAMLARYCAARGHDVTWWTSTFDHVKKQHRAQADTSITTSEGVRLEMLYAPAYKRNISVRRLYNHYLLGKAFARRIRFETPPDVILAAWPTIELSEASVKYGIRMGIPVIVDVRDLWPYIFADAAGAWMRPAVKAALHPLVNRARYVFRNCTGILGISPGYLKWALAYAGRDKHALDVMFPLGYEKPKPNDGELVKARNDLLNAGVSPSKAICWFVGVFGSTYDLSTVIKSAAILQARGQNRLQFVFSGRGEKEFEWGKQAEGLHNVVFTGYVDATKICCLGQMAQIGLAAYASSAPQGLPNKMFEYMAFGLPILSSLAGEAQPFLAEHRCGLTYKAQSPDSLIASLAVLENDERLRKEYGDNGRRLYEQFYCSEKVYTAMADYLESVASRKSSGVVVSAN
jgi:glycosyltransferase involved in cell wall biosynthesis